MPCVRSTRSRRAGSSRWPIPTGRFGAARTLESLRHPPCALTGTTHLSRTGPNGRSFPGGTSRLHSHGGARPPRDLRGIGVRVRRHVGPPGPRPPSPAGAPSRGAPVWPPLSGPRPPAGNAASPPGLLHAHQPGQPPPRGRRGRLTADEGTQVPTPVPIGPPTPDPGRSPSADGRPRPRGAGEPRAAGVPRPLRSVGPPSASAPADFSRHFSDSSAPRLAAAAPAIL